MAHVIYLSLGSNIDPVQNLPRAVELLKQHLHIEAVSGAWQNPDSSGRGPDFINAAICARTDLQPAALKSQVIRPIEAALGRVRTRDKYAPRPIDIDLVVFDGKVEDLQLWDQAFLAVPLAQLQPDLQEPLSQASLAEVSARLAEGTVLIPRNEVLKQIQKVLENPPARMEPGRVS